MPWLLDTNAVIAVVNSPTGTVAKKLRRKKPESVAISSIVLHELFYGAFKSAHIEANLAVVDSLAFQVLAFDAGDARAAGAIRAALAKSGNGIGAYDVLIAGQALNRGYTLVSHNLREFTRIERLTLEDWEA